MGVFDYETALEFHEQTKHSYVSVRTTRHMLDWSNKPNPFKTYIDLPTFPLPPNFPKPAKPVFKCFENTGFSKKVLDLETLASILFFTGGITRVVQYGGEVHYFRAAPATGALYPIELYVVAGNVLGLEDGVYHFNPKNFCLTQLRKGDFRGFLAEHSHPKVAETAASIIFTSIPWRNAWKYRERSYRHWFWDAGVMMANTYLTCNAFELESFFAVGFVDEAVNKLLGLDGVQEAAIAVAPIGFSEKKPEALLDVPSIQPQTIPLSRREIRYELIQKIHATSCIDSVVKLSEWRSRAETTERRDGWPAEGLPLKPLDDEGPPLWKVILQRGSTRKFSTASISYEKLSTILKKASFLPPVDFAAPNTYFFTIANAVDGIPPGAYLHTNSRLILHKQGVFRKISGYLCLEQQLGEDAAAVFYIMAPLEKLLKKMGSRGYRAVQLEGGIRAGLVYIAAYGLGLGATGLTFYDDEVTQFFQPLAQEMENVIVVAVGMPAYRAKPGKIHSGV